MLAPPLIRELNLLQIMQSTREAVWPLHAPYDPVPDNIVALKAAIAAVQEATGTDRSEQSEMRFKLKEADDVERTVVLQMLLKLSIAAEYVVSHSLLLRSITNIPFWFRACEAWITEEIEFARRLTTLSTWSRNYLLPPPNRSTHPQLSST